MCECLFVCAYMFTRMSACVHSVCVYAYVCTCVCLCDCVYVCVVLLQMDYQFHIGPRESKHDDFIE